MNPEIIHFEMRPEQALKRPCNRDAYGDCGHPTAPLAPPGIEQEQVHLAGGGEGRVAKRPAWLALA